MKREREKHNKKAKGQKFAPWLLALIIACVVLFAGFETLTLGSEHVAIYLAGGEEMNIEYGNAFADPGAKARVIKLFPYKSTPLDVICQGQVDPDNVGSYVLTYRAEYQGQSYEKMRTVNITDTTPPELTLNKIPGYSPSWIEGYKEEGYTAVDLYDGDLTDRVDIEFKDNEIIYSVRDSFGNEASQTRKIDYAVGKPTITLQGGESIELNPRPYYTERGYSASDDMGNELSAYVKCGGEIHPDVPGEYRVEYYMENPSGERVSVWRSVKVKAEECPETVIPDGKTIYLTFDDGPGPYTDKLLDVLDKYGAKATFFVTGNGEKYNSAVTRAYNEGHSIGVHTFSHNYAYLYGSDEQFYEDFNKTQDMIYELTGAYTQLYRFPGGSSNTVSRRNPGIVSRVSGQLEAMGYRYFDWNVSSGDAGETTDTYQVIRNIINACAGKDCAIVLQHDIKPFSVAAVESVLIWGANNGYSFKALDLSSPGMHHNIAN